MEIIGWRNRPVAGIGIIGLDHVAVTDRFERDGKSAASLYFEQVGGPVPVALMTMARLGLNEPPLFAGVTSEDDVGTAIRRGLDDGEVDVSLLHDHSHADAPRSLVVLCGGSRSVTNWNPDSLPTLAPEQIGGLRGSGLLHVDGRDTPAITAAVNLLREYETVVSLDLGSFSPAKAKVLPLCDIILASKAGGAGAFPDFATDPIEQTKRFLNHGATVAGVTLGADGVVVGCRDENGGVPVHLSAFPVADVVDTCGAGDCFHGAFLWAYRAGKSAIESARFAQAAVALRIQHYGNVAGLPTRAAVESCLAAPL